MLKIRPEQFTILADDSFKRKAVRLMRSSMPAKFNESRTNADLMALATRAIENGRARGIRSERELARWIIIAAMTSEKSYDDPGIKKYLGAYDVNDQNKVKRLYDDFAALITVV